MIHHVCLTDVGVHSLVLRDASCDTVYCLPGVSREDQGWTLSGNFLITVGDIVGQQVFAVRAHGGLEDTSVPVAAVLRPYLGTPAYRWERLLDNACPGPHRTIRVVCVTSGPIPTSPVPLPTLETPARYTGEVATPATPPMQDSEFGTGASDSTGDSGVVRVVRRITLSRDDRGHSGA